jgi:hypothetical protein
MLICENVPSLKIFNNKFEGFKYASFFFFSFFLARVLFRHIFETCGDLLLVV